MTNPILPVGVSAAGALTTRPANAAPQSDLHRVAEEFEAMLLRQLLSAAKMGGGAGAYNDMAVDALANGINQAGGVGLARQIETVLSGQIGGNQATMSLSHSSPDRRGRSSE